MSLVTGINHVAVLTSDIDRFVGFYRHPRRRRISDDQGDTVPDVQRSGDDMTSDLHPEIRHSSELDSSSSAVRTRTTPSAIPTSFSQGCAASSVAIPQKQPCGRFNARWTSCSAPNETRPNGPTPDSTSSEVVTFATSGEPFGPCRTTRSSFRPTSLSGSRGRTFAKSMAEC